MDKEAGQLNWNDRISYFITSNTELFFYKLGRNSSLHPKTTILISISLVLLSCTGFIRFYQEKNPLKLWVPPESTFVKHSEWLMKTFERGFRAEGMIIEAPDVLTPEVLKKLAWIDKEVKKIVSPMGQNYKDLCLPIPKIPPTEEVLMKIEFTCDLLEFLDQTCFEQNILELWNYNSRDLESLTKDDILYRINKYKRHPIYSNMIIYENLLGDVVKNETGHIVSAKYLHTMWQLNVNYSSIDIDETGNAAGTSDFASPASLIWEKAYLDKMQEIQKEFKNMSMSYMSSRSFADISNESMFQDIDNLCIGAIIVMVYIQLIISKFNWVDGRFILSLMGLLTIAMAYTVCIGLSSLLGVPYGPVHASLPFLLLGLGVDDMFVMLSCWEELTEEQHKLPIHERMGTMLKHAGVSITVTTFTDILAFLVGSITILPSLQSYCIYAAIGVFTIFALTCTFYVACCTYDANRMSENRNCLFPCIKYKNFKRNKCSNKNYSKTGFDFIYSRIILTWPGKLLVILIVVIMSGFSIESLLKLEQRFDPIWFIPSNSYMLKYVNIRRVQYPFLGFEASLFIGAINYTHEFKNIKAMSDKLVNNTNAISLVNTWVPDYQAFVMEKSGKDVYEIVLSDGEFDSYLSEFLFKNGSKYQPNFQFRWKLVCGEPAPKIEVAAIDFRFRTFSGPEQHLPAMREMVNMTDNSNFTTGDRRCFVWSITFATWLTDEIIYDEVARNLILALVCVMTCTTILIADIRTCFWIFICVLTTMVNVSGFMQRWGITIDITSCIGLELAIGLCVDYATHIGHTFLTIPGDNKNERSLKTVTSIGAAVLYGGLSTLIGVLMLSRSEAYAFKTFFKIFFLVTTIGLFNGVVLLPVILSWFGPKPYKSHITKINNIVLS